MLKQFKTIITAAILCLIISVCNAEIKQSGISFANTLANDGVSIAYSVYGKGDITLAFIHGWSCDQRYWHKQIPYFETKYRVITIDLAGHGHSGVDRKVYTMEAFGQDVVSVLKAIDAKNVILAGHSMGGSVILQAAALAPDRIIGIIGVDTLQDMGRKSTEEEKRQFYDPLAADFKTNTKKMVRSMFPEGANQALIDTVARDMSAAPSVSALSAMNEYMKTFDEDIIKNLNILIKCVNADFWPTNLERNKQLVSSFELAQMKGYGHFIMLEAPNEFNKLLEQMVENILKEVKPGK